MTFRRVLALAVLLAPVPLAAQFAYQPVAISDADALAEQMRRLGANPTDLDALLTAGELSVRLEDLNAAGAFFTRAEKIDPRSGRAKAGEGAILVRSERPGEALRYFGQAEQLGLPVARFAGDRGLAYDLLGDPGRAQRDYKLALASRDDPEARRRYALSLGIAGRQAQALDQLAPLIRQNDRAAWRSRAFVLAMGGNAAEASRIAQTMMPPGAAAGLQSFFAELPRLPAVDRAFAVHFGDVRPTPQRLADARVAPAHAPLALDPLPVQVAAVTRTPVKPDKSDRKRDRRKGTEVAVLLPTPAPVIAPLPSPPAYQAPIYVPPTARTPMRDRPLTAGEQASLAAAGLRNLPGRSSRPSVPSYTAPVAARGLTSPEQASLAATTGRTPAPPVVLASVTPVRRDQPVVPRATPAPGFVSVPRVSQPVASTPSVGTIPVPRPVGTAAVIAPTLTRDPVIAAVGTVFPITTPTSAPLVARSIPSGVVLVPSPAVPLSLPSATPISGASAGPTPGFSTSPTAPLANGAVLGAIGETNVTPAGPPPSVLAATALPGLPGAVAAPAAIATPMSESNLAVPSPGLAASPPTTPDNVPASGTAVADVATTLVGTPPAVAVQPIPIPLPTTPVPTASPAARVTPSAIPTRPATRRPRLARGQGDSILARIVGGLTVPATELDVGAPTRATPGTRPLTAAGRRAAARQAVADKADAKPVEDKKATAAARKALADKKAAADKKVLADKEAADAKRIERAQPARIWVQVAGGANDAGLNIAWRAVKGKAPGAFGARQAYTTPLRATNRVLTGPFKTDAEARAYVNQLAKAGVPAFTFTSDKGQKITKLDTK